MKVFSVHEVLAATQKKLHDTEAERDALAARNYELVGLILRMRDRWWPFVHGSVCPSDTAYNLGKESADILSKSPQQFLRDIQAEAGRKGFIAGGIMQKTHGLSTRALIDQAANAYAAKVRKGGA